MSPSPPDRPAVGEHEAFTARWGARKLVQNVLALGGLAVFAVLALATDLGRSIGMVELGAICVVAVVVLYFPLSWLAVRWVDERLARLR